MRTFLSALGHVAVLRSVPRPTTRLTRLALLTNGGGLAKRLPPGSEVGYALIELLVACVVAGIVFAATLTLLVLSQQIQARDTEWALTLQEDRAGLRHMLYDIRQASKVEEANSSALVFLAEIGGKSWKIKYECAVSQPGTEYKECVRLAAEEGKALPSTGPAIARDVLDGTEAFSYAPSSTTPTIVTVKIELPAQGTLKQGASSGYRHRVVLEDAAFMRNLYLQG